MVGKALVSATVSHPRTARRNVSAEELTARIEGRTVTALGRHGKFIEAALSDGQNLIAHLGMSGRFSIAEPGQPVVVHTHAVLVMDGVAEVRFIDPRTFGFLAVFDEDEESPLARLGPDAWATPPTVEGLTGRLAGRSAPIKALLLDQTIIAGLGNIYADEVLHLAGVHPLTSGGAVAPDRVGPLLEAVREVLTDAIEAGGTTLDDLAYLLPDGQAGENLERLDVYGRQGLPCPRCGSAIERVIVRGRSTHFCPKCQP
jgi:formamidopyrimidine-DNA glycosylase